MLRVKMSQRARSRYKNAEVLDILLQSDKDDDSDDADDDDDED